MSTSVFDIFKIGIGPSSSHTVGPMKAALAVCPGPGGRRAAPTGASPADRPAYGSLGATGRGHGSDRAVLLGLEGESPDTIDPDLIDGHLQRIRNPGGLGIAAADPGLQ
jgi:L-serine dehydratase